MTAYRVFTPFGLVAIAAVIAVVVLVRGGGLSASGTVGGFFKKQGVAWGLTLAMVFAAIGIGYAKAPFNDPKPENVPAPPQTIPPGYSETIPPASADSFVWDNAQVLSDRTVRELDERNDRLWNNYNVTVGVVTCDYGGDDLYGYALQCADDMGLGGYDMIVVLDILGDNYWLLEGNDIRRDFTDQTASDYAYDYMEEWFAAGDYDFAVCQLTEMLELWYGTYYG